MLSRCAFRLFLGLILVTAAFSSWALAQQKEKARSAPYKVGQRVTVNWRGIWVPGIVLDVDQVAVFGHVRVKTKKMTHGWPFDLKDIRPLQSHSDSAGANPEADNNPFATDEEKFDKLGQRTWSDTTGSFKVEARVARLHDGAVVLRRADGKEITVPLEKLSSSDRTVLSSLFGRDGADDGSQVVDDEEFLNTLEGAAPKVKIIEEYDTTKAEPLNLGGEVEWTYVPRRATEIHASPIHISLGPRRDVHDELSRILFSPDMSRAIVIFRHKVHPEMPSRVIFCDLKNGSVSQQVDFYAEQLPLAISSDGKSLISRSEGYRKSNMLYVHAMDGYKAEPKFGWKPYAGLSDFGSQQDVADALLIDNDHLLTISNEGSLQVWNVAESVEPLYFGRTARRGGMALELHRDCLAIRTDDGVVIIEPASGKSLGRLAAAGKAHWPQLAIRGDGQRLALAEGGRIRVWDLGSHELLRDFSVSNVSTYGPLVWTDDDRILTGGSLIDVERRVLLWQYTELEAVVVAAGGLTWSVCGGRRTGDPQLLIGAVLPHPEAKKVAEGLDPEEILAIKPGMEVGIALLFGGSVADQEIVRSKLSKRLEEVGLKPVGQSAAMLTASVTRGEPETVSCQTTNLAPISEHTVAKHIMELALSVDGKKVWATNLDTRQHGVIQIKEGETLEQAVARERNINPRRFELEVVPSCVARPKDDSGVAYGTSKVPGAL